MGRVLVLLFVGGCAARPLPLPELPASTDLTARDATSVSDFAQRHDLASDHDLGEAFDLAVTVDADLPSPDLAVPDLAIVADLAPTDLATNDLTFVPFQSCAVGGPGMTDCHPGDLGVESCCTTLPVPSGPFLRSFDNVDYTDGTHAATVSEFRLDKYEITVGRFRQFVAAVSGGWRPAAGAGKHEHLNGAAGLSATGGGFEGGWDAAWNTQLPSTLNAWTTQLDCTSPTFWSASVGDKENLPIVCENWYQAYAFCIWDGGFLPSETEWNYAAAGGGGATGQRVYPWSSPSTSATISCFLANYAGCGADAPYNVGDFSPKGDGAFGQADLAGNVSEWTLDYFHDAYVSPCVDCANLTASDSRTGRGGSFSFGTATGGAAYLEASMRYDFPANTRGFFGARCARAPLP